MKFYGKLIEKTVNYVPIIMLTADRRPVKICNVGKKVIIDLLDYMIEYLYPPQKYFLWSSLIKLFSLEIFLLTSHKYVFCLTERQKLYFEFVKLTVSKFP